VAVLYAVRPDAPFWRIRTTGYNHIFDNGTNQWRDTPDKDHNLIEFAPDARDNITGIIERLMNRPPVQLFSSGR
jgi:hypothetical protein